MDWKKVVREIEMKDEMKEELLNHCRKKEHVPNVMFRYSKAAAVVIGLVVCSVGSLTAYAAVSAYQARMESMEREEIQHFYDEAQIGTGEAYTYSRAMTDSEEERLHALRGEYENGRFPEGEISRESVTDGVYYESANRCYVLPDRELTDEELLQILDMWAKTDYSLQQINSEKAESGELEGTPIPIETVEVTPDNAAFLRGKEIIEGAYGVDLSDWEPEITYLEADAVVDSEGKYQIYFRQGDNLYGLNLRVYNGEMSRIPGFVFRQTPKADESGTDTNRYCPIDAITEEKLESIYNKAEYIAAEIFGVEEEIAMGHCMYQVYQEGTSVVDIGVLLETESGERYLFGFLAGTEEFRDELTYESSTYGDLDILGGDVVVQMK